MHDAPPIAALIAPPEAEKLVAGSVLRGPEELDEARTLLRLNDFTYYPARLVFDAACQLRDAGQPVNSESVYIELQRGGRLADLGENPALFLVELLDLAPTAANLTYAAGIVREAATLRDLRAAANELIRDATDRVESAEELAARYAERIADTASDRRVWEPVSVAEALKRAIVRYTDAEAGVANKDRIPTGFPSLDQYIGGLAPGQMAILAARPSVGKTAMELQMAEAAARRGTPTLVFSLEMTQGECIDRLVASVARVSLPRLRGDKVMTRDEAARVLCQEGPDGLTGLPLWLDDAPVHTAASVAAVTRLFARRRRVKLVAIDYLQLLGPENPKDPRHIQVGQAARRLKQLAREAGVAVVCLAQLNREVEQRGDGKPRLSDLRDSGEIEQHADVVLLLHRLEDGEREKVHRVNLIVAKNRGGPTGLVELDYHRPFTRFEERAPL